MHDQTHAKRTLLDVAEDLTGSRNVIDSPDSRLTVASVRKLNARQTDPHTDGARLLAVQEAVHASGGDERLAFWKACYELSRAKGSNRSVMGSMRYALGMCGFSSERIQALLGAEK